MQRSAVTGITWAKRNKIESFVRLSGNSSLQLLEIWPWLKFSIIWWATACIKFKGFFFCQVADYFLMKRERKQTSMKCINSVPRTQIIWQRTIFKSFIGFGFVLIYSMYYALKRLQLGLWNKGGDLECFWNYTLRTLHMPLQNNCPMFLMLLRLFCLLNNPKVYPWIMNIWRMMQGSW